MIQFWIAVAVVDYEGAAALVMCNSAASAHTRALNMKHQRLGDSYYIRGPFRMDDDVMCADASRVDVQASYNTQLQSRNIYTYVLMANNTFVIK